MRGVAVTRMALRPPSARPRTITARALLDRLSTENSTVRITDGGRRWSYALSRRILSAETVVMSHTVGEPVPRRGYVQGVKGPGRSPLGLLELPLSEGRTIIVLGIILIIVGYIAPVPGFVATIGWILLVIGLILTVLGATGHGLGGRKTYF